MCGQTLLFIVIANGAITPHFADILVDIQPATDLALDMVVVCSDIHVLGSPLMSAEATTMQDLASEFLKILRG